MRCSPSVGALPVPEILAPHPASACNSLHFGSGIEENQSLGPDLFFAAARAYARAHTRDARGRVATGHPGNPRGRPPGIPNPQRRVPDLRTLCLKPGAASALARRKPRLLRPMLAQILPPAAPVPPAERLGVDFRKLRRIEDVQRAMRKIWVGLARGAIGPGEAARLARRGARPRRLAPLGPPAARPARPGGARPPRPGGRRPAPPRPLAPPGGPPGQPASRRSAVEGGGGG